MGLLFLVAVLCALTFLLGVLIGRSETENKIHLEVNIEMLIEPGKRYPLTAVFKDDKGNLTTDEGAVLAWSVDNGAVAQDAQVQTKAIFTAPDTAGTVSIVTATATYTDGRPTLTKMLTLPAVSASVATELDIEIGDALPDEAV